MQTLQLKNQKRGNKKMKLSSIISDAFSIESSVKFDKFKSKKLKSLKEKASKFTPDELREVADWLCNRTDDGVFELYCRYVCVTGRI